MRAYLIDPPFDTYGVEDDRTSAALDLIAEIVFQCLRRGGDEFQYSVVWVNPGGENTGQWNEEIAEPHVIDLRTDNALREWVRKSVDPNHPGGGVVRSIATCRCFTFGYDGQAFLCLREEDEPPVSPDPNLANVEERPELIANSDYFDGWVRSYD
jgi:hypothetical protein